MPTVARPALLCFIAASVRRCLIVGIALVGCGRPVTTGLTLGSGTITVQLTDAAFLVEDVQRAEVFVVRIDMRLAGADSMTAARGAPDDSASDGGWTTILTPNTPVNLLDYQHGIALSLGSATIAAGTYKGFRLIIDPHQSRLTLADGTVLTNMSGRSQRGRTTIVPDSARSGIRIFLLRPIIVREGQTTTVRVDFAGDEKLRARGMPIANSGLVFRPILRGAVLAR
jgi:hypothetical protein